MTAERRKYERKKVMKIVHFRKGLFSGVDQTVTKDMSIGGLCFFSGKKIKLGNVIRVRIFNNKKSPDKVIKGRVVWCRQYDDSLSQGYLYGLSYLHY
jgi:hypothetical protein